MARVLKNVPNVDGTTTNYPNGKIRNKDNNANPAVVGSPIVEEIYGDIIQFFQKLLIDAGITANGNPDNVANGYQLVDALKKVIYPSGTILNWYGNLTDNFDSTGLGKNKWLGWALMNGQNGTPSAAGKFFVNYDDADPDYNALGKTGGSKTHTLTEAEMPTHGHAITDSGHGHAITDPGHGHTVNNAIQLNISLTNTGGPSGGGIYDPGSQSADSNTTGISIDSSETGISIDDSGSGDAHENRPPFFAAAFIIKL